MPETIGFFQKHLNKKNAPMACTVQASVQGL